MILCRKVEEGGKEEEQEEGEEEQAQEKECQSPNRTCGDAEAIRPPRFRFGMFPCPVAFV